MRDEGNRRVHDRVIVEDVLLKRDVYAFFKLILKSIILKLGISISVITNLNFLLEAFVKKKVLLLCC